MQLLPGELIRTKRDGGELSPAEIHSFFDQYIKGSLPDYQMAAMLMAIYFKGFTDKETYELTQLMIHSGAQWERSSPRPRADKHSTGGVGDKTSLLIAPIVAACGVDVPMISGRGLGHTGGTLDKLESIPGFNTRIPRKEAEKLIAELGLCFIGQSDEICPADRKLYALRDVTGTVESIPLISASIMSKKISETLDALILDVKFGSGAFMKSSTQARKLAQNLVRVAEMAGVKALAFLTSMNQPLGEFAGNALEVRECLKIMTKELKELNRFELETLNLSIELSAGMIQLAGKAPDLDGAKAMAHQALASGKARENFEKICKAQGGDLSKLPLSKKLGEIRCEKSGVITALDTEQIGYATVELKVGRKVITDSVDATAGIQFHKKIGDAVQSDDVLFTLFGADPSTTRAAMERLEKSYSLSSADTQPHPHKLILETISGQGSHALN